MLTRIARRTFIRSVVAAPAVLVPRETAAALQPRRGSPQGAASDTQGDPQIARLRGLRIADEVEPILICVPGTD